MSQDENTYSAFISYSHALDGTLAPTLQREIERFAKPWFRMRMLRVFRDNANLSAQPDLWSAIENALSRSDWLILLASPEAARSEWVDKEVSWWLANRSPAHLLIVVTSGEFVWDQERGDIAKEASTALPPALHGALAAEPRWVDLRWLRDTAHVDRSNPRLRECVADIAATVREVPKDLLVGEHIRQHRRTMRLAWSASVTLVLLLVLSVIGFGVAVAQRDEAVNQARIATARQLAASAVANTDDRLDLAQLLAVEAYRMEPGPQTRAALFQSVTASPHLVRSTPIGASVTTLATAPDTRVAVAGTDSGELLRWDLADNTTEDVAVGDTAISDVAVSGDGTRVIATDGTRTFLWSPGNDKPVAVGGPDVVQVAISPSGQLAATLAAEDTTSYADEVAATLSLVDTRTGEEIDRTTVKRWGDLTMDDDSILATNDGGEWQRLSTAGLATADSSIQPPGKVPATDFFPSHSATGLYFGYLASQHVYAVDNLAYDYGSDYLTAAMPITQADSLTISDNGTYVAATGGGSLYATRLQHSSGDEELPAPVRLDGQGRTEAIAFLGDGPELVTAAEGTLSLWDLDQPSPLSARPRADLPSSSESGGIPRLSVSPDGMRVAVANDSALDGVAGPAVHDFSGPTLRTTPLAWDYTNRIPLWSPDAGRLLMITDGGATNVVENGQVTAQWPARGEAVIVGAQFSSDGSRVLLLDQFGGTQVRDAATGDVRSTTPPVLHPSEGTYYESAAVDGAAETAAFVSWDTDHSRVLVVDVRTGRSHELPADSPVWVTFSGDNLFVQHEDGTLDIWDTTGTTKARTITGDVGYAPALTVVPHTGLLVRLRGDGTAVISRLDSGEVVGTITLPPMTRSTVSDPWAVTTLTATRDTGELITATSGGQLAYWRLAEDTWTTVACDRAGRDLTPDDWRRVVGLDPPDDLRCDR